jgi:hypothetical protein
MALISINKEPSNRDLWYFELFLYVFMLGAAGLCYFSWGVPTVAYGLGGGAAALLLLFRAVRPLRKAVYLGWIYLTFPIGFIISHVMFFVLYFLILTPIGLLKRAFGSSAAFPKRFDRSAKTYWEPADMSKDPKSYFKQY